MIVSLRVYLKTSAFKSPKPPDEENVPKSIFNEGQETLSEQVLRERKSALINLFEVLGVKPTRLDRNFATKGNDLIHTDLDMLTRQERKAGGLKQKSKMEIVGDGEEVEVEDDEEQLDENELNLIYKKYRERVCAYCGYSY